MGCCAKSHSLGVSSFLRFGRFRLRYLIPLGPITVFISGPYTKRGTGKKRGVLGVGTGLGNWVFLVISGMVLSGQQRTGRSMDGYLMEMEPDMGNGAFIHCTVLLGAAISSFWGVWEGGFVSFHDALGVFGVWELTGQGWVFVFGC